MEKKQKQAVAKLNYLKIAPRKTRLIAHLIKGMNAVEAEAELLYRPHRAAKAVLKLLRSAISNAANLNLNKEKLFVSEIRVDEGPMLKRFMPRAQGRATPIHKKMSHVSLTLAEKDNAQVMRYKVPVAKLTQSEKQVHQEKDHTVKEKEKEKTKTSKELPSKTAKGGFGKKMFHRKAIG